MANHVYKTIEITGSSPESMETAIKNAVSRAAETVRRLRWLEVLEARGQIDGDQVSHWQVTVKLGFTLDD